MARAQTEATDVRKIFTPAPVELREWFGIQAIRRKCDMQDLTLEALQQYREREDKKERGRG